MKRSSPAFFRKKKRMPNNNGRQHKQQKKLPSNSVASIIGNLQAFITELLNFIAAINLL